MGKDAAERIVAARAERPFADMVDLSRRAGLTAAQLESLATAGACAGFGHSRREALWHAGFTEDADQQAGTAPVADAPTLPGMSATEETLADLWASGVSPDDHPLDHLRDLLRAGGVRSVAELAGVESRRRVHVAGLVTHRQRPGTASGITFLSLEDETGMLNVVCSPGLWHRHRRVARNVSALVVRGILEREDGVTNLVADRLTPIVELFPAAAVALRGPHRSRDFH
jgi:error-prone DNA polymerase